MSVCIDNISCSCQHQATNKFITQSKKKKTFVYFGSRAARNPSLFSEHDGCLKFAMLYTLLWRYWWIDYAIGQLRGGGRHLCFLAARNLSPSTEHRRALVGSCERVARYKYSITVVVHSLSIIAHDSSVLHNTPDLDHVKDDFFVSLQLHI